MKNNNNNNQDNKKDVKKHRIIEIILVAAIILLLFAAVLPLSIALNRNSGAAKEAELISNLNTALRTDREEYNHEHRNMTEALDAAQRNGYNVSQINANKTNNEILWDSKNDVFVYYNNSKGDVEYVSGSVDAKDKLSVKNPQEVYYLWKICKEKPSINYSMYWVGEEKDIPNIITAGFDSGKTEITRDINYSNNHIAQKVTIRTNSLLCNMHINGPMDSIYHYGQAKIVNIKSAAPYSYHEYGELSLITIDEGRIVLNEESDVGGIHFNAHDSDGDGVNDEFGDIIVDITDTNGDIPSFYRDPVDISDDGTLVCIVTQGDDDTYFWLEKDGIYEQMTISETEDGEREWVNTSDSNDETKQIANDIANTVDYDNVEIDEDTREIVVEEGKNKEDYIGEGGKTAEEAEQIIDIKTNIKAYVEEDITTPNDLVNFYFNTQYSDVAFVDKAYKFNAFTRQDAAVVDAFINAKINGKNIFTNDIDDYSDEEKIQSALSVIESELGVEARNKVEELLGRRRPYFRWLADFEVTFSKDIKAGSVALMGHYASFADEFVDGQWVGFGVADYKDGEFVDLVANKTMRLLDTAYNVTGNPDFHMNYAAICGYVREFSCGFANLSPENEGVTISVTLNLYEVDENGNETGNKFECGRYSEKLPAVSAVNQVLING